MFPPSLQNLIWSDPALADIFLQFIELKCLQQAVVSRTVMVSRPQSFVKLKICIFLPGPGSASDWWNNLFWEKFSFWNLIQPSFYQVAELSRQSWCRFYWLSVKWPRNSIYVREFSQCLTGCILYHNYRVHPITLKYQTVQQLNNTFLHPMLSLIWLYQWQLHTNGPLRQLTSPLTTGELNKLKILYWNHSSLFTPHSTLVFK